ncbi:hypothetical protein EBBID32_39350 [Sphingobium indicum BiD32]|uniref:Uncharacterized protein n=2 Tax=Sphingobium TaxID=165695 RepID=N1MVD1_9SPHN|nr:MULTISPECIES: hypothetical protein [Sphingobium]GBH32711.1 hypothetical protein MBESOW_P3942 [Sphingobium xenophagum]CCW19567.1 hypothetical protein EBBID32_39350 [Sphingobium indicum BiD32]
MADYHSPTVVRPSIPLAAITSLEHALLCQMFEHESDGDAVYFFASDGPSDTVWLDIADLKTMLDEEPMPSGPVVEMIRTRLAEAGPDETELELDLSDLGDAAIFQQIVRRCDQLDHVVITSAWTCTKMRPDGFGGGVTVVTADHILSSSTSEMEAHLLDRCDYGELGCAPGHGKHGILAIEEAEVRSMVADIQQAYVGTDAAGVTVSDEHIRQACIALVPTLDLDEQLRGLEFSAAMAAIRIARAASA